VGVDRLSLSFPILAFEPRPDAWDSVTVKRSGWANQRELRQTQLPVREGVSVFVGVASLPAGAEQMHLGHPVTHWAKLECNPARILEPDGHGLADPEDLASAVGLAMGVALRVVTPVRSDPREHSVKRVDVAKDFAGVEDPGPMIRALGGLHRPWSRRNLTHTDPLRNGAQTLMVGSGAGVVRLYDKNAETKGEVAEGTLRWEAECRSDWAHKYGGVRLFGGLNAGTVAALAADRWEWSQMGAEVAGSTGRLVKLVHESDLTMAERRSFLGFLIEQSAGVQTVTSKATLAKYRRVQRDLGIVSPADFASMVEVVRRLDWETAKEVVSVRAA
jgi:hypothetical protein